MKGRGLGCVIFILLFIAALITVAKIFPYDNDPDNPLNRILPLGGFILGHEPEAWIGDIHGKRVAGKDGQDRPLRVDVDFIKVKGRWHKIKGPVYITKGGRMVGWHKEATREELASLGRWPYLIK